jgi:hypothetical protein
VHSRLLTPLSERPHSCEAAAAAPQAAEELEDWLADGTDSTGWVDTDVREGEWKRRNENAQDSHNFLVTVGDMNG